MVKLESGREVELKPLNYLQRAELMDESVLYLAKCNQVNSRVPISMLVVVKTLKYAGIIETIIEEMTIVEQIEAYNEIWRISGLDEIQKKS